MLPIRSRTRRALVGLAEVLGRRSASRADGDPDVVTPSSPPVGVRANLGRILPARRVIEIGSKNEPPRRQLVDHRLVGQDHGAITHGSRRNNENGRSDSVEKIGAGRGLAAVMAHDEDIGGQRRPAAVDEHSFN